MAAAGISQGDASGLRSAYQKSSGGSGRSGGSSGSSGAGNDASAKEETKQDVYLNGTAEQKAGIEKQIGMNRTATGQAATIERMYYAGQLSDADVEALKEKFDL